MYTLYDNRVCWNSTKMARRRYEKDLPLYGGDGNWLTMGLIQTFKK